MLKRQHLQRKFLPSEQGKRIQSQLRSVCQSLNLVKLLFHLKVKCYFIRFKQNKKEKKLKREQALAQAKASKRQSDAIFKNLEEYLQVCNQNTLIIKVHVFATSKNKNKGLKKRERDRRVELIVSKARYFRTLWVIQH